MRTLTCVGSVDITASTENCLRKFSNQGRIKILELEPCCHINISAIYWLPIAWERGKLLVSWAPVLLCPARGVLSPWIGWQARSDKTNTSLVVKLKHQLEIENVLSGNDSVLKKQKLDGASAYGKLEPPWLPRQNQNIYLRNFWTFVFHTHRFHSLFWNYSLSKYNCIWKATHRGRLEYVVTSSSWNCCTCSPGWTNLWKAPIVLKYSFYPNC